MKTRYWILLLAGILMLCICLSIPLLTPGETASHARIISDGTVIATWDLSKDDSLTVTYGTGYNYVTVRNGKIGVAEASCPDHYCMQRGFLSSGTDIVCLPNRLIISFATEAPEVDAIVG